MPLPPANICILDIETFGIRRKEVEKTRLAFVGTKEFKRSGRTYRPVKFRAFFPEDMERLEYYLKSFPGLIVGHRLFHFDYRVLSPLIDLHGIIEKSADTRHTLLTFARRKIRWCLFFNPGLDRLCGLNFGLNKTLDPAKLVGLLKEAEFHRKAPMPTRADREAFREFFKHFKFFKPRRKDLWTKFYLRWDGAKFHRTIKGRGFLTAVFKNQTACAPAQRPNRKKGQLLLEQVIRYNENDLDLTQRLWCRLVSRRPLRINACIMGVPPHAFTSGSGEIKLCRRGDYAWVTLDEFGLSEISGQKSTFTFESWRKALADFGGVERGKQRRDEYGFYDFLFTACPNCDAHKLTQVFDERRARIMTDRDDTAFYNYRFGFLKCMECGFQITFGKHPSNLPL